MDWHDYGWNDNWTWGTGSDSTGNSALSQPQQSVASSSTAVSSTGLTSVQPGTAPTPNVSALHSTVNVTDLETGDHIPSRRTGTVTRPVPTGTGLLNTFVSVVFNSFGRPQGLPLIPETVSSPEVTTPDEYDDVLGRHH